MVRRGGDALDHVLQDVEVAVVRFVFLLLLEGLVSHVVGEQAAHFSDDLRGQKLSALLESFDALSLDVVRRVFLVIELLEELHDDLGLERLSVLFVLRHNEVGQALDTDFPDVRVVATGVFDVGIEELS